MSNIKNLNDLPAIMTVQDIGEFLQISKNNAYFVVKSKGFPAIRIGKQFRIPKEKFIDWLNSETKAVAGF